MKTFMLAFTAAILIAVQCFTPAAAAASSATVMSSETCGKTYTVQHLDNLSKIAMLCGTSVANLMALNPEITNANLIFTGQVLKVSGNALNTNYAKTYIVRAGDTLAKIASMFNITYLALWQANPVLWYNATLFVGQKLNIPTSTTVVYDTTTATSGNARVSLSTTSAGEGDKVTVYVSGFPANSWIDYRVGEVGEDYSTVYDGIVDSDGSTSLAITIPSDADKGEYWVVLVTTTSQKDGVEVTSPRIYITD